MTAILHSAGALPPGLVAAVWPGTELASGFRQSGGFSRTVTPGGDAIRLTGTQHLLQRLPAGFNFPLTFVSVFRRNVASPSRVLASVGSGTQRHLLYFASGNSLALYSAAGAATGQCNGIPVADTTGVHFAAGRVSSAASRDVFVDGVFYSPNTATANTTPMNVHAIGAYWNNDAPAAGFTSDADILFSGLWNRALSNAEILDLQQSWRRIARPAQRRIWVPVSAGGPTYASATSSSAFTVRGFAAASQAGAWSVRNHAAGTRAATFTVRAFASASRPAAWTVRAHVGAAGASAWSVRNHVSASAPAAFSVLAAGLVSATASAAFSVRNHTTASRSAAASVRNFTSASASSAFSVLASGLVTASRSAAWTVRNAVTASAGAAFTVRNHASALQAGAWSVRSAVAATRSAAWSVKAYVYHTTGAAWSVDGDGGGVTPWPTGRADPQHQAVVPFFGVRAMVPAADVRAVVTFTGVRAIVQQDTP